MEVKIKELDEATRELVITLPIQEYEVHIDSALREAQKNIELKGFRKGKVPISIIKQKFGNEIEKEMVGELASELFHQAIHIEKIQFVGKPSFIKYEKLNESVLFTFSFDVIPSFELSEYKGLKIMEPFHRVTDEEIEHEIFHKRVQSGYVVPVDEIKHELTFLTAEIQELDRNTEKPIPGQQPQQTQIYLHSHTILPEYRNLFIGKKKGETFVTYPRDWDNSAPENKFKFSILDIFEIIPSDFDDEFVKKYTNGKLSSTDELKEEVGYQLQEKWDLRSRDEMIKQIIRQLVDINDFDVPRSVVFETAEKLAQDFLNRYRDYPEIKNAPIENIAQDFIPIAEDQVRWAIIKKKIIEKENIKVEDFDIEEIVEEQSSTSSKPKEEVRKEILENSYISDTILEKKVLDFIISFAETTEIDFDKFLAEKEHYHNFHNKQPDNEVTSDEGFIQELEEAVEYTESVKNEPNGTNQKGE